MGLDYSSGCVNFRDVGESLELVADRRIFPSGRLYRGGKIDFVTDLATIQAPATILNLPPRPGPPEPGGELRSFPRRPTTSKNMKPRIARCAAGLNEIMSFLGNSRTQFPLLVHCTSGKDRTGVVVAALLTIVGIPQTADHRGISVKRGRRQAGVDRNGA